jgi:hypothetical protein
MQEFNELKRCKAISSRGERCDARPLKNQDFCFFHQPDKERPRQAQIKGGQRGKRKTQEFIGLKYIGDVKEILEETINNVRNSSGTELQKARTIGSLLSVLLRYFEVIRDIEGDETIVEKKVLVRKKNWIEEAFKGFPEDVRERLLSSLVEKKHEILVRFAKEIQIAKEEIESSDRSTLKSN